MGDTLPEGFTTEIRAVAGYDHRDDIKDRLAEFVFKRTKSRPLIMPVVVEV